MSDIISHPLFIFLCGLFATPIATFFWGRQMERFKLNLLQTQKADKIAELFSYMPQILSGWKPTLEDTRRINQLVLELSLYLPKDLVFELSETLCRSEKQKNYKDCFVKVREYLLFPRSTVVRFCMLLFCRNDGLRGENISHLTVTDGQITSAQESGPR